MILTIVLGGLAGWGAAKAEPQIRGVLEKLLQPETPLSAVEARVYSFAICLLGAAIVAALADEGRAVWLVLGALLGAMGPRLLARAKAGR